MSAQRPAQSWEECDDLNSRKKQEKKPKTVEKRRKEEQLNQLAVT